MRMLFAAAGAALLLGLSAPAAFAGDASCVWRHLPDAKKVAALKIAADNPIKAMESVDFTDEDLQAALVACGVRQENWEPGARATGRYTMVALAEEWFRVNRRISPSQLDTAWRALPAADRELIKREFDTPGSSQSDIGRVAFAFAHNLGLTDTDVKTEGVGMALSAYVAGRAGAEALEDEF